jgi:hypothetical protein
MLEIRIKHPCHDILMQLRMPSDQVFRGKYSRKTRLPPPKIVEAPRQSYEFVAGHHIKFNFTFIVSSSKRVNAQTMCKKYRGGWTKYIDRDIQIGDQYPSLRYSWMPLARRKKINRALPTNMVFNDEIKRLTNTNLSVSSILKFDPALTVSDGLYVYKWTLPVRIVARTYRVTLVVYSELVRHTKIAPAVKIESCDKHLQKYDTLLNRILPLRRQLANCIACTASGIGLPEPNITLKQSDMTLRKKLSALSKKVYGKTFARAEFPLGKVSHGNHGQYICTASYLNGQLRYSFIFTVETYKAAHIVRSRPDSVVIKKPTEVCSSTRMIQTYWF